VADSGLPWTTLRATQFHDLLLKVAEQMAKLPVIPVPAGVRFQPVDTDEVAARLVELTLGKPAGLVPDMAGPRVSGMADLLRGYLRARHKHRLMVPVRLPGKAARAFRAGANLSSERAVGQRTWEDFLAERVSLSSDSRSEPTVAKPDNRRKPLGGAVALVVDLEHCEVGHEAIGGGAVPVVFAGLEEDAVAGADDLDRSAGGAARGRCPR
jgi:hypothetical protein